MFKNYQFLVVAVLLVLCCSSQAVKQKNVCIFGQNNPEDTILKSILASIAKVTGLTGMVQKQGILLNSRRVESYQK